MKDACSLLRSNLCFSLLHLLCFSLWKGCKIMQKSNLLGWRIKLIGSKILRDKSMQCIISNPLTNLFWTQLFFVPRHSIPCIFHWENAVLLIKFHLHKNTGNEHKFNNSHLQSSCWKLFWDSSVQIWYTNTLSRAGFSHYHVLTIHTIMYIFFLNGCSFIHWIIKNHKNSDEGQNSWEALGEWENGELIQGVIEVWLEQGSANCWPQAKSSPLPISVQCTRLKWLLNV